MFRITNHILSSKVSSTMMVVQVFFHFIWMLIFSNKEVFGSFGKHKQYLNYGVSFEAVNVVHFSIETFKYICINQP